jgi:hypothetical protein
MGYDQHWSFGVQRQLPAHSVLGVNYVGNRGVNLYEGNPINDPLPGPGAIQARRPYSIFGVITYNGPDNSTIYQSLQAKFEKRLSAGLWYLVSYTWSKSINVGNAPAVGGDCAYERAVSSFDIPQNLRASAGYELPVGRGKSLLSNANRVTNGVLGGWQLRGIVVLRSGRPFTPTISRDVANTGIGDQRPNRTGSGKLSNPTIAQWSDKSAFALPASFTYGNSGANIDTASGGVVTSTISAPRNIQFGLKLIF